MLRRKLNSTSEDLEVFRGPSLLYCYSCYVWILCSTVSWHILLRLTRTRAMSWTDTMRQMATAAWTTWTTVHPIQAIATALQVSCPTLSICSAAMSHQFCNSFPSPRPTPCSRSSSMRPYLQNWIMRRNILANLLVKQWPRVNLVVNIQQWMGNLIEMSFIYNFTVR